MNGALAAGASSDEVRQQTAGSGEDGCEFIIFFETVRSIRARASQRRVALNTKQRMHLKEVVNPHSTFCEGIKSAGKRRKICVFVIRCPEYT